MPETRTPSQAATDAAENLWVIVINAQRVHQSPEAIKRMMAGEVQRAMDAEPVSDPRQAPLLNCLTEIVAVLCYQPSIPQGHKYDLGQALNELKTACGIKLPEEKRILE